MSHAMTESQPKFGYRFASVLPLLQRCAARVLTDDRQGILEEFARVCCQLLGCQACRIFLADSSRGNNRSFEAGYPPDERLEPSSSSPASPGYLAHKIEI